MIRKPCARGQELEVAAYLLQTVTLQTCHKANIRMHSHRLLRLDDKKSTASCQQA